ncbi:MAG TPA: M1 family aminopeptidase, partial [Longimicrobiales bacterium]
VAGQLVSEQLPADGNARYEAVFQFEQPAEGIDLAAGPYQVRQRMMPRADAPPIRLRTYFFRDMDALAEGYLTDSARYLALYADLIGPYPFSGFSVVASPLPAGFGMPSFTYIGARVLKLPFIRATSLGHEVLHNWWGNGVYVDYATGNWSEGLTTFMADYLYREEQSAAAAKEMRLAWLRDFAAVPEDTQRPLSAFRSRTHGAEAALGYGKAAMVFFMLRDEIGDEALRRGIRGFWSTHRFKVASWNDLRIAFEQASGRSLDAFFEQWVQRAGSPRVEIEQARLRDADGKHALTVTLRQSAPTFALRVPLEWVAGDRSGVGHAALQTERAVATFLPGAAAHGVRLDPDFRLWRRLEPEALPPILRQWIIARTPRVAVVSDTAEVRRAAQTLTKRFFEAPVQTLSPRAAPGGHTPLLMIGLHNDVARTLAAWRLPPAPEAVADRGTARVWTIPETGSEAPIAVVSGSDADAIAALAQPLPHYGGQSYVVFEGSRAVARGIWPAQAPLTPVTR